MDAEQRMKELLDGLNRDEYAPKYYRPDGTRYPAGTKGLLEWGKDFEDWKARTVGRTYLWWGGEVSTVWLGIDHSFAGGPPLIFETMVFYPRRRGGDLDVDRYTTKAEALEGHKRMIGKWSNPLRVIGAILHDIYSRARWRI